MLIVLLSAIFAAVTAAGTLEAQPAPYAALAVEVGSASLWRHAEDGTGPDESGGGNAPSVGAAVMAGLALGPSVRVAALGDALWLPTAEEGPELILLAGGRLEYAFPPGAYYLFGQAGLTWFVQSPWDSGRNASRGPGYALGAGYRLDRLFSIEGTISFSTYGDAAADDGCVYRHIAVTAALRASLP